MDTFAFYRTRALPHSSYSSTMCVISPSFFFVWHGLHTIDKVEQQEIPIICLPWGHTRPLLYLLYTYFLTTRSSCFSFANWKFFMKQQQAKQKKKKRGSYSLALSVKDIVCVIQFGPSMCYCYCCCSPPTRDFVCNNLMWLLKGFFLFPWKCK